MLSEEEKDKIRQLIIDYAHLLMMSGKNYHFLQGNISGVIDAMKVTGDRDFANELLYIANNIVSD